MGQPVGTWDPELFDAFRNAKSTVRRRYLQGKLIEQNMPLIKKLLDQFIQPSGDARRGVNLLKGGTQGFTDIPWEDGYQQALIAFCKTMDAFEPEKLNRNGQPCKLPWYFKMKLRHELQTFVVSGLRTVRIPRGHEKEMVHVELTGEQETLDRYGGSVEDGLAELEGATPEDLERWQREDSWPTREEWEAELKRRRAPPPPPPDPRTELERFFDEQLLFKDHLREPRQTLASRWERMTSTDFGRLRPTLLQQSGVRQVAVRAPWDHREVVWGFAGVALRATA